MRFGLMKGRVGQNRMGIHTKISSSLRPVGPAASRSSYFLRHSRSRNSSAPRTEEMARRRSKGWERKEGLMVGGAEGLEEARVMVPVDWVFIRATAIARYCSGKWTEGPALGLC